MLTLSHRGRRIARTALLPLALVPFLGGAVPASAGEMPIHHYSVLVEGEADYTARDEDCCGVSGAFHWIDAEARFTWRSEMADFPIYGTKPTSAGSTSTAVHTETARRAYHLDNKPPVDGECTGNGSDTQVQGSLIHGLPEPAASGAARLHVYLLEGIEIGLPNCTGDGNPTSFDLDAQPGATTGPWEDTFEMPVEAFGNGKIIQLLERRISGAECPNADSYRQSCDLSWKAKITLTKTHTEMVWVPDEELLVPLIPDPHAHPAPPQPGPQPGPQPVVDEDLLVPLTNLARLSPAGAAVPVSCPSGCTGEAVAVPLARGGRAAARPKPLARKRFSVAPGGRTTVRLRFDRRARRAVARAKGVRIVLTATPRGAKPVRRTLTLRRGRA